MDIVEKLAEAFGPELPGIDWESIQRKTGLASSAEVVMDTSEPTGDATVNGAWLYQDQIQEAYDRADQALKNMAMPWDVNTEASRKAWNEAKSKTATAGEAALSAFRKDFYSQLSMDDAVEIEIERFRIIVTTIFVSAVYSFLLHRKYAFQNFEADPRMTVSNAEEITKAFNLIDFWHREGALKPLQAKSGTGAVQIPVVVGTVVAITSAALIAALAWSMIATKRISATNAVMKSLCDRAIETGDERLIASCIDLSDQNQVALDAGPSSFTPESIFKWLAAGAALYLIVISAPTVLESWRASRSRTKRESTL